NYSFNGVDEEITFFKEVKPLLMKEYVFLINLQDFYQKYADLEIQQPKVYKKEINRLMHFIRGEKNFYTYIKGKHTYNDEGYFRRLANSGMAHSEYSLNADMQSCCSHGLLYAKLLAYEKLIAFYSRQLKRLKEPMQVQSLQSGGSPLEWKANKVDAVELVYALYYSGAVNTEKCTVFELAKQFGDLFQIQITDQLYREYIDIK